MFVVPAAPVVTRLPSCGAAPSDGLFRPMYSHPNGLLVASPPCMARVPQHSQVHTFSGPGQLGPSAVLYVTPTQTLRRVQYSPVQAPPPSVQASRLGSGRPMAAPGAVVVATPQRSDRAPCADCACWQAADGAATAQQSASRGPSTTGFAYERAGADVCAPPDQSSPTALQPQRRPPGRWRHIAEARRRRAGADYGKLLIEAQREVPGSTVRQIEIDCPRTFSALPEEVGASWQDEEQQEVAQDALLHVLVAIEWWLGTASRPDMGLSYTQGMNFMAALCLADVWSLAEPEEGEELAFWLLDLLLADILGVRFFAEWPPLVGYHTTAALLRDLVPRICGPALLSALGDELEDFVEMLSCRHLVPCFVGLLPCGPLLALWDELLAARPAFLARPLYAWLLGLLQHLEPAIVGAVGALAWGEPRAPAAYQATLREVRALPEHWRPPHGSACLCPSSVELARAAAREEERQMAAAEDRRLLQSCGAPADRIAALRREFQLLPRDATGRIGLGTLRKVLKRCGIENRMTTRDSTTERFFRLVDRDGSGSLDFLELMTGLLVLSAGGREHKLRLLFELYDADGSGYLTADELLCLGQALAKMATVSLSDGDSARPVASMKGTVSMCSARSEREGAARFRQRLLILDMDGDGSLSLDEFRAGVASEPALMQALSCVGVRTAPDAGDATNTADEMHILPRRLAGRRAAAWGSCCA